MRELEALADRLSADLAFPAVALEDVGPAVFHITHVQSSGSPLTVLIPIPAGLAAESHRYGDRGVNARRLEPIIAFQAVGPRFGFGGDTRRSSELKLILLILALSAITRFVSVLLGTLPASRT